MTYPAAHSMDVTWFCVDADGNVGVFDSGENGTVPEEGGNEEALFDTLIRAGHPLDLRMFLDGSEDWLRADLDADTLLTRVLLLAENPRVAEAVAGQVLRTVEGRFVYTDGPVSSAKVRALQAASLVRGVWDHVYLGAQHLDAFHYEATHHGPYYRTRSPRRPLTRADLPKDWVLPVLPVRFPETSSVQPASHLPCSAYDGRWMDVDGDEWVLDADGVYRRED